MRSGCVYLNPLVIFLVIGAALSPCTSGPVALGYFFGWPWAVGGIVLCWGAFVWHQMVQAGVPTPYPDPPERRREELDDDGAG